MWSGFLSGLSNFQAGAFVSGVKIINTHYGKIDAWNHMLRVDIVQNLVKL